MALLSRRQYLSRMDRFQHGRSARTLGREGLKINKKCRVFTRVRRGIFSLFLVTDLHDRLMFPRQPVGRAFVSVFSPTVSIAIH